MRKPYARFLQNRYKSQALTPEYIIRHFGLDPLIPGLFGTFDKGNIHTALSFLKIDLAELVANGEEAKAAGSNTFYFEWQDQAGVHLLTFETVERGPVPEDDLIIGHHYLMTDPNGDINYLVARWNEIKQQAQAAYQTNPQRLLH